MGSAPVTTESTATVRRAGFYPVPTATLSPTDSLEVDLYIIPGAGKPPVLYRECNLSLSDEDINRIHQSNLQNLYIPVAQQSAHQRYLQKNLQAFLENETIPPVRRFEVLQDSAREVLRDSFRSDDTHKIVHKSAELSGQIVQLICGQASVASQLFHVMHHDYETFHHAINVASYGAMLAQALGIQNRTDLEAITTGGLLHDLGKRHIPQAILTKNGPLTDSERRTIQSHPTKGFEELCRREDLSWGQLMMVLQHHERVDGRGYPMRLVGADVHEWGRLCAVVDVFDAMSSP